MGPPPPSSSSMPNLPSSAADDWFRHVSDRDTQILTQALSICSRGPTPACSSSSTSSQFPSPASYSSASHFYETFGRCLDGKPLQSESFESLRTLQKQQHLQQQLNHLQQQKALTMSSMLPRSADGFSQLEQVFLQKGSPLSKNSSESSPPLSASAEAPASPFSTGTLSQNSAVSTIATESFFVPSNGNNPQNYHPHNGHFVRESSCSSKMASIALSSQTSIGAGGSKVHKRKSRVSNCKTPIAVLSADASNFRAMVQQLTGIPSSSSMQSLTHGGIPLLKPQPIRHPFTNTLNLPTLDTSACFLGPKNPEGFSYAQRPRQVSSSSQANVSAYAGGDLARVKGHNGNNTSLLQSHMDAQSVLKDHANGVMNQSFSSMLPMTSRWDSADSLEVRGSFSSLLEGEQFSTKQSALAATPDTFDSLLMDEHSATKSSMGAVDSWFSFLEGAHANHASNMEIARMA